MPKNEIFIFLASSVCISEFLFKRAIVVLFFGNEKQRNFHYVSNSYRVQRRSKNNFSVKLNANFTEKRESNFLFVKEQFECKRQRAAIYQRAKSAGRPFLSKISEIHIRALRHDLHSAVCNHTRGRAMMYIGLSVRWQFDRSFARDKGAELPWGNYEESAATFFYSISPIFD